MRFILHIHTHTHIYVYANYASFIRLRFYWGVLRTRNDSDNRAVSRFCARNYLRNILRPPVAATCHVPLPATKRVSTFNRSAVVYPLRITITYCVHNQRPLKRRPLHKCSKAKTNLAERRVCNRSCVHDVYDEFSSDRGLTAK